MKAIRREDLEWTGSKEEAKEVVKKIDEFWNDSVYYCRHGEYCRPDYNAVKTKEGWVIRKKSHFYIGTIFKGYSLNDGEFCEYLDTATVNDYLTRE